VILRRDLNLTSQAVAGPIPRDENADVLWAFHELKTYAQEIPSLLRFNEVMVVSDGVEARVGSLTGTWERYMRGQALEPATRIRHDERSGAHLTRVFEGSGFLNLQRRLIVFEDDDGAPAKKIAEYH
jgi:type I restriction enzyme R subunit